jgi:hypothetical protein
MLLDFLLIFIKHHPGHGHTKRGHVDESLLTSEKLSIINNVDGVLNVSYTKIAEEFYLLVRKIIDKMLGQSDTDETGLKTAVNYTNSAHICDKFLKKINV